MLVGQGLQMEAGEIKTYISKPGQGHGAEFWAERAMERIMTVSETAPQPIRDQAMAFRERIANVVLESIRHAVAERKAYDVLNAGKVSEIAAQAVREGV